MNAPQYLWLLPLVLLYWLLHRREKCLSGEVSTFFLWEQVLGEASLNQKQNLTTPILQCIALTLLLLSFSKPEISWKTSTLPTLIVFDCSLSMQTKDLGQNTSRFEQAKEWIQQQKFQKGKILYLPQEEYQDILYPKLPKKCTTATFSEEKILAALEQFKKEFPTGKTLWLSDHKITPNPLLNTQILFGSKNSNNVGIVHAAVKGFQQKNKLFVLLHNWADTPQKRTLIIEQGKQEIYHQQIVLNKKRLPKKESSYSIEIPFNSFPQLLKIYLAESDSLAADNQIWLNPTPEYKIFIGAIPQKEKLKKYLDHFPHFSFVESDEQAQVSIGFKKTKASWNILLKPLKDDFSWSFASIKNKARIEWQKEVKHLDGISFVGKSLVGGYQLLKTPSEFVSLAEYQSKPVIGEYPLQNGGLVFWGVPLAQRMQELELGLFLCNLLEREFRGSPLFSHYLEKTSQKNGWYAGKQNNIWISAAHQEETNHLGERFVPSLNLKTNFQEKKQIELFPFLITFAVLFFVCGWFYEEQGVLFSTLTRGKNEI